MKEIIAASGSRSGARIIVDENKTTRNGIKGGDIVRDECALSCWYGKVCLIAGLENNRVWYEPVEEERHGHINVNTGKFALLSRPGLKYRVGDKISFNGHESEVLVINPINPLANCYYISDPESAQSAECASESWWPEVYKEKENVPSGRWVSEEEISEQVKKPAIAPEKLTASSSSSFGLSPVSALGDLSVAKDKMPEWAVEMALKFRAGIGHLFILYGNIYCDSLYRYLAEIFGQRDLVMLYSLSSGLQFANEDMEKFFRSRFLEANVSQPRQEGKQSATKAAAKGFQQNQAANAPLSQLIGDTPFQVLKFLETILTGERDGSPKCSLIIDFAHNVASNQIGNNAGDRVNAEILERWARDSRIKAAGNTIILLSPSLAGLADGLRSSQSGAVAIRIPKPDCDERTSCWSYNKSQNIVEFSDSLTPELLGRITSGLSLKQINDICRLAKEEKPPINLSLVKKKKQEILETEFGDRVKIIVPRWGFDYFGGKEYLKRHMLEMRDNILNGMLRRVPMGILAKGPPGTGKTFFFACWAYECGFNFIGIENPRIEILSPRLRARGRSGEEDVLNCE